MESSPPRASRMSYDVHILANAQRDLTEIEAFYDENAPEVTERLLDALQASMDWIALQAHTPAVSRYGLRHVSTQGYPYRIWYRLFEDAALVQGHRGVTPSPGR
ncbi:MAG: type II toxin-antitoxin system RelE/ParE family toxin [Aeromicrobium sp.]|uniref:hypothetical protein n=1 Tax=Aeromicrobium sp. TaxID=1871063 RepID=UPI0039E268DF